MSHRFPMLPALLALGIVTSATMPFAAHAQTAQSFSQKPKLTTLHSFDRVSGERASSTLTLGPDGNLYGVTEQGGEFGAGTIFEMTREGKFITLFSFNGRYNNFPNGYQPSASLTFGTDGALYGTARRGGGYGGGTAFRITVHGTFTKLHDFGSPFPNSNAFTEPGGLLAAADGSFYGTTFSGGEGGEVFHMTAQGDMTTLHAFTQNEGSIPAGRLVFGADGALYGTTLLAGIKKDGNGGYGSAFRLTTDGAAFTVLHVFTIKDGSPQQGLTPGLDGYLYGTTSALASEGAIYKVTPAGMFTTLHKFSEDGHGINPNAEMMLGMNGLFYGTTVSGGTNNRGTVFQMTPTGQVTTLYKFHTDFDGQNPYGGVVFGLDGLLYGVTSTGVRSYGTIYKLTLPQ